MPAKAWGVLASKHTASKGGRREQLTQQVRACIDVPKIQDKWPLSTSSHLNFEKQVCDASCGQAIHSSQSFQNHVENKSNVANCLN